MTAAISVASLSKSFGSEKAVDNISFEVPSGAVTGFIGANGSGKTTTMRMIVGLTLADAGDSLIHGQRYSELPEPRRQVGVVLSRLGGHPGLTGRQHLRFIAASAAIDLRRTDEGLEAVGLSDAADRKLGTYSTGMSQRLALAAALLAEPEVLILDEPMSGLDPRGIAWLRDLLRARADAGAAVFVSTHQLSSLEPILDHVVVIDGGRVVATGSPTSLTDQTHCDSIEAAVLSLTENQTTPLAGTHA